MTGRILFKSTLENYLEWFIGQKIEQVSQEHRVVRLVHLLRGEVRSRRNTGWSGLVHLLRGEVRSGVTGTQGGQAGPFTER